MKSSALETLLENYFIELFRTDPVLRKKQFRNSDSDRESQPDVITIEAKQAEDILEGPRGPNHELRSKVDVTARYRSTNSSSHDNDLVAEAMQNCVRTASTRPTSVQKRRGFYLLIVNENITADRGHTKASRNRQIVIPCEAGLLS